jgi:hypothetical protein
MVSLADILTDPQSAAFYERFADHPALDIEDPMLRSPRPPTASLQQSWRL